MKKNSFFFIFLFLFLFFCNKVFCDELANRSQTGYEQCEKLAIFIENLGYNYIRQNLIYNENENFPFNIEINFYQENKNEKSILKEKNTTAPGNLAFIIKTEEALDNSNFIKEFLELLNKEKNNAKIKVVFTYGDEPIQSVPVFVRGSQVFAQSISEEDSLCALCIQFSSKKTSLIPGSGRNCSPAWLIKLISQGFFKNNISYNIKGTVSSSLYRIGLLKSEPRTADFLRQNIPSAGIELFLQQNQSDFSKELNFFAYVAQNFNQFSSEQWDQHCNPVKIGNFTYILSEKLSVIFFIFVAFASLFILCEFSFITKNPYKQEIFKDIQKIWYLIPLAILITMFSLLLGQGLVWILAKFFKIDVYTKIAIKLVVGFAITSFFYLPFFKQKASHFQNSYSYITTLSTVANIFIFTCIDISFFYLFTLEYLVVYIFRPFKKTVLLALEFVLMGIPFAPYIFELIKYGNPIAIEQIVTGLLVTNIFTAAAFVPFEIQWFRILAGLNEFWKKSSISAKKFLVQNVIAIGVAVLIFLTIMIAVTNSIPKQYKTKKTEQNSILEENSLEQISIDYSEKEYFSETERTLTVTLTGNILGTSITVKGKSQNSIVYSDSPFISDKSNFTDTFVIPQKPPRKMTFHYICEPFDDSTVFVSAYYLENSQNEEQKISYKTQELFIKKMADSKK